MNGLSPKAVAHAAVVHAQDSYAERQAAERRASGIGFDPGCRLTGDVRHVCVRNTGEPIGPGMTCFAEARMQLRDQFGVTSDGALIDAMAAAESPIVRAETTPWAEQAAGPVYRLIDCGDAA